MKNNELEDLKEHIKAESSYQADTDDMNYNGQAAYLFQKMVDDIFEIAKIEKIEENVIYQRVKSAEELIRDFQGSIRYRNELAKNREHLSQRYRDFMNIYDDLWYINNKDLTPMRWLESVYFHIDDLSSVIEQYLSYDWLQSPAFEYLIINAQVRLLIMRLDNESWRDKLFSLSFNFGMLLIAIGMFSTGKVILIAAGCALSYFLWDILQANFRNKKALQRLLILKTYLLDYVWSPKFLKSFAAKIAKDLYLPNVISLLSKLEKRNNDIFIIERMPLER